MSKVRRLEVDCKGLPFYDDSGAYVLYEDYAKLKAQHDALAELVLGEITYELAQTHCHRNDRPDITHGFHYGANWMRAAILRKIEEAK